MKQRMNQVKISKGTRKKIFNWEINQFQNFIYSLIALKLKIDIELFFLSKINSDFTLKTLYFIIILRLKESKLL